MSLLRLAIGVASSLFLVSCSASSNPSNADGRAPLAAIDAAVDRVPDQSVCETGASSCGMTCADMLSQWTAYLSDPAMVACATSSDCIVVGGQPETDPCNGYSTIGYCGEAANEAGYRASPAASLELEFAMKCTGHIGYDCGPGHTTCSNGRCVIAGFSCCFGCSRDAAF